MFESLIHITLRFTGKSLVLLQPDFDIPPSEDDWILLDSVFNNNNDYDKLFDQYKYSETTRIQTVPAYPARNRFTINYCIPTWIWSIPILLVLAFIWMQYGTYINSIFIQEDMIDDLSTDGHDQLDASKRIKRNDDFGVSIDSYFYPMPAVPPPKYNEAIEAEFEAMENRVLIQGDLDDDEQLLLINAPSENITKQ